MLPYALLIIFLFFLAYIDTIYQLTRGLKIGAAFASFIFLIVITGLRWETGTDWIPYTEHYQSIDGFDTTSPLYNGMEFGYNLFVWLTKLLFNNYTFFLLVHAFIFYLLLFQGLKKYTPFFFVGLLLFYTYTMGVTGSNRQLISLMICLYSVQYVIKRKAIVFFLLLFVATLFHTSALLFFFVYFINKSMRWAVLLTILAAAFIVGKTGGPQWAFSFLGNSIGGTAAGHATDYIENAKENLTENSLSMFGLVKRLAFVFLFFFTKEKIEKINPFYNIMLNSYIAGIAFYFIFSSSLLIMVNRGSLYFNMFEPILLSCQLSILHQKSNRLAFLSVIAVVSVMFFIQSIAAYPDLFIPYKGIFINRDFKRNLH